MREIKFRIWDKENNKYVKYISDENLNEYEASISVDGFLSFSRETQYGVDYYEDEYNIKDRFIIEQYTGLKDIDGNEIYENDYLIDDDGELHRIDFDDVHGGYVFWEQKKGDFDTCVGCLELSPEYTQIVGNLMEGPDEELIKIKQEIEE